MDNNLKVLVTAELDKLKSVTQINQDIKKIEEQLKKLKLQATLDKGKSVSEIQNQIKALNAQKRNLYVDLKLRKKGLKDQYKQAIANIQTQPLNVDVNTATAQKQMSGLTNSVKATSSETVRLGNTLNKTLNNIGLVVSAQTALNTIRQAAQEATEAVKEYDKMSTNLQIITGQSKESVNTMISDPADKSLNYNVDISDLEKAQETLLRTGKSVEDVNYLLKDTIMLAKTGFMDTDDAAESLVTIANAYNYEADEMENVVSKFLALDTASNTVAGKLSTAIAKSAQNAKLAGLSIDKLGGYISTLKDTTGKAESEISTALNSIFSRVYNVKLGKYEAELEDGTTENITESLNDTERMLKNVGIQLRSSKGEFKDVDDIIKELSEHWNEFNSVEKNSIAKTFAGTMHKNSFISLIENYDKAMQLAEVSAESAGTATKKYSVYMESIEAKSAALSTSLKELWNNLIPNGFVGNITDATTGLVKFTDEYQILQTAIKSATFYALAKGIVSAKNGFAGMITDVKNVSTAMDMVGRYSSLTKQEFDALKAIITNLSDSQLKLVLSNSNLTESEMITALSVDGTSEAEAKQKLATLGITQANNAATASTFSLSGAFKTLWATIAANPVMVLTMAFTALVSIYQKVQREQEEARKNAVESAEKYEEQATSLANLRQEYINIVDSESDVSKKTEELNKWKETLIETYGFEKEAIEKVNLEREKGLGLLDDEITKNRINSAETWLTENKDSYEDAKKKLTSRNNSSENAIIPQANVVTQVTKDALNDFSDNFDDILKQFSISNPTKDNPLAQIKLKGSNTLEQYENLNEILNEITSIKVTKGLNDAEEKLYNSLLAKQKTYKKVVTDDIKDIYETGNKYTNAIKLFNFETDNGINFENVTQDTYKEFRDKFLESLGFGDKKDSTAFSLDIEQVLLDMMPDFEKSYRGIEDSVSDEIQNLADTTAESSETSSKALEDLQKAYDDLSKSVSNFTKVQKTFTSALEEQEKHSQLSASTIQDLSDAGYAHALVVDSETGAVTLNKQAYEQLNKQKRKAIELDLEAEKSDLVTQLNEEKNAIADLTKEYEALNQVPNKTQDITDRISAITLEFTKRGENITAISELIDKINGNVSSLDAPEFGSDKKEKPQSVLDFEAEYAEKQHEINMDRIEEDEDYYSWLLSAAHTAYDGLADYQDDLWKYEEEVYKGRKQLAEDFYDEQQKDLEDRISNLENNIEITTKYSTDSDGNKLNVEEKYDYISSAYQEIINELNTRIGEILDTGIEGHEEDVAELEKQITEYQEKLNDVFKTAAEEEQDYIKKLKDNYSDLYDERIKKIKEQQDAAEKAAQAEIDAVQEKIDALKDANDKEQEALDIEKARQELSKASQNTRQVYGSDGSISYQVDKEKVQEAQENLDNLLQEQQINILEDQKDLLEQAKDKESEAYDSIITNLETEKENSEKRFDILLDALDEYLNPDQGESNSDVWKTLAHLEGATYKNGVWSDKDGNVIDIDKLVKSVEDKTDDKKNTDTNTNNSNGKTKDEVLESGSIKRKDIGNETSDVESKKESAIDSFFASLEKRFNMPSGSLTPEKAMQVFNTSSMMKFDPYESMKQRSGVNVCKDYVSNVNNNRAANVTIGDININNPVGNSNDLAKELMLNIPIAFQKQMYSNLGR